MKYCYSLNDHFHVFFQPSISVLVDASVYPDHLRFLVENASGQNFYCIF